MELDDACRYIQALTFKFAEGNTDVEFDMIDRVGRWCVRHESVTVDKSLVNFMFFCAIRDAEERRERWANYALPIDLAVNVHTPDACEQAIINETMWEKYEAGDIEHVDMLVWLEEGVS